MKFSSRTSFEFADWPQSWNVFVIGEKKILFHISLFLFTFLLIVVVFIVSACSFSRCKIFCHDNAMFCQHHKACQLKCWELTSNFVEMKSHNNIFSYKSNIQKIFLIHYNLRICKKSYDSCFKIVHVGPRKSALS